MKALKKYLVLGLCTLTLTGSLSSCATVFGGRITDHQRRKPGAGEPQRAVRTGALIADIILFWPGLIVDFATGAIYKPNRTAQAAQQTPPATQPAKASR